MESPAMNPESTTVEPTAEDILGPDGPIARNKPGYETRPQQLAMAEAVADAIASRHHLVVEAGTGVGKSLAYAVPAILAALESGGRVIIGTNTIALQEQLIGDLKFLRGVMPKGFKFALVKGRNNYLSLRRLGVAVERTREVFPPLVEEEARGQLGRLRQWTKATDDGSKSGLDFLPLPVVWEEVRSDDDHCLGKKCANFDACFYYASRAKMKAAQVLVVNHALYLTHVKVARKNGVGFLPEHDVLVLDEAHTLEDVASKCLGEDVSDVKILRSLNRVSHERTKNGLLERIRSGMSTEWFDTATKQVARMRDVVRAFSEEAERVLDGKTVVRFRDPPRPERWPHAGRLVEEFENLIGILTRASTVYQEKERSASLKGDKKREDAYAVLRMDADASVKQCWEMCRTVNVWLKHLDPDTVFWIEHDPEKRIITLAYAPLNVGPVLKQHVWDKVPTCILTSATLAVGSPPSFAHVRARLGLEGADVATLAVGSPFHYAEQVNLYLPKNLPDPADPKRDGEWERQAIRAIPNYLWKSQGRAFVLFTSNAMMREAARVLRRWIHDRGWPLLVQDDLPPAKLLEKFRAGGCVLFGVDSFWAGVDVAGAALSNVIIVRLPFPPPGQPLLEARMEDFRNRGGHPFFGYQVPEAVIKFKQGFGRLIRSKADRGIAVVLDPRLTIKGYGRDFLESLPTCRIVRETLRDSDLRPALATTSSGAPGDSQAIPDGSGW
jgi:ATP-dependent DNA helicase DinG